MARSAKAQSASLQQSGDALNHDQSYSFTVSNTYQGRDAWVELSVASNDNYHSPSTASTYDAYGRRIEVDDTMPNTTTKHYLAYDASGGILSRRDGEWKNNAFVQAEEPSGTKLANPTPQWISATTWNAYTSAQRIAVAGNSRSLRFAYANGQLIGRTDQAGAILDAVSRLTAFSSGSSGANTVTVQTGDSLQAIAQRVYGNASLWYVLASANALEANATLTAGRQLKAPDMTTSKNDASTFKPYGPDEVINSSVASAPYIALPNKSCGTIGMIIMIVIAVAVMAMAPELAVAMSAPGGTFTGTLLTTGVFTHATVGAAVSASFLTGVAGSVLSQVAGKAMGNVEHFSLRQAVASGITSAATVGLGEVTGLGTVGESLKNASFAKTAGLAVAYAVAGYAGNRIAGVSDTHFSWKSIAASAVSSLAVAGVERGLGMSPAAVVGGSGDFGKDLVQGLVGGVVTLSVRGAFGYGSNARRWGEMAADAFGNALGNAAARGISEVEARREQAQSDRAMGSTLEYGSSQTATGTVGGDRPMLEITEVDTSVDEMQTATYAKESARFDKWEAQLRKLSGPQAEEMRATLADSRAVLEERHAAWIRSKEPSVGIGEGMPSDSAANAADGGLIWLNDQFEDLRNTSRQNVFNASSAPEAVAASIAASVNEVSSAVASGFVSMGRLVTSPQTRANTWQGLKAFGAHPIDGIGNAYSTFQGLSSDEKLRQTGALLATAGTGSFSKLGNMARVADDAATLVARESEALGDIAARNSTAGAKSLHERINARAIGDDSGVQVLNSQKRLPRVRISAGTKRLMGPAPLGMKHPHMHHILEANGRAGAYRSVIREGQDILRSYNVDPLQGVENLVWAPNKGHTISAATDLVEDLSAAQAAGASRTRIVSILRHHGLIAARR